MLQKQVCNAIRTLFLHYVVVQLGSVPFLVVSIIDCLQSSYINVMPCHAEVPF